jgi:hypothetical protein
LPLHILYPSGYTIKSANWYDCTARIGINQQGKDNLIQQFRQGYPIYIPHKLTNKKDSLNNCG